MKIQELGTRGVIFTFEDGISVYLIKGDNHYILCDTHLGPVSMEIVKNYLHKNQLPEKSMVIFNSHSDWDHVWGNCAFPKAMILGHEASRTRLQEIGAYELNSLKEHHKGEIQIILPSLTFNDKFTLAEEEVEFQYAPGHTVDSSLCFDRRDSILYVGDLVEDPIPYIDYKDLNTYVEILSIVRYFPAQTKISAHSGIISNELIEHNISYLKGIISGNRNLPETAASAEAVHQYNLNNLLLLEYEPLIRRKLGKNFDYASYKSNFKDLGKISSEEFKEKLEMYLEGLGIGIKVFH